MLWLMWTIDSIFQPFTDKTASSLIDDDTHLAFVYQDGRVFPCQPLTNSLDYSLLRGIFWVIKCETGNKSD